MIALANPSGCTQVQSLRRRTRRAPRPTLLQRLASAFSTGSAAMCEHLDQLGGCA